MSWLVDYDLDQLTQGVVVDNVPFGLSPSPLGIILSNPCDLEWNKASYILIASLIPAKDTIQSSKEFKQQIQGATNNKLGKDKWKKLGAYISQFVHNVNIMRYFFVDPSRVFQAPSFFVDFQHIVTVPITYADKLEPIGFLPSPHREKMIVHFSSYISRIGVDRIDEASEGSIVSELATPYKQNS